MQVRVVISINFESCFFAGLEILQILHGPLDKAILCHIQVSIDFHGCPDTGMANGFGESGQVEVGIIFVFDVVVGHIGMAKTMHGNIVS